LPVGLRLWFESALQPFGILKMLVANQCKTNPTTEEPPLCVDLDGTLIAGDLLYESVLALLRQNFLFLFLLPLWLLRGRAHLKEQVANRVQLNAETLPYRSEVVAFLQQEKKAGRYLVLATASHIQLARRVADHLELFDEVIATEAGSNLKGAAKLAMLVQRFDHTGFDYIGDSRHDLPLWQRARKAYLVQPSRRLLKRSRACCTPAQVFHASTSRLRAAVKLLRPHQWVKNFLLFVPLVLAHEVGNWVALGDVFLGFVAYCLCASSVYIFNDLLDLQADRAHPHKKRRPVAAGLVSIPLAIGLFVGVLVSGLALTFLVHPPAFTSILLIYLIVSTAYTFYLKRQPMVDVFVLAALYSIRILAGGVAADVPVSGWLIAFSLFFFISLALVKRYAELARIALENCEKLEHRGYHIEDLGLIQSIGPASGYMAVLTMCLYINAPHVLELYREPQLLWVICFVLFFWITRVWFLARRRKLNEDPVVFATTDLCSYLAGLTVLVTLFLAT
jgi:4-hydroxybenzoate polyprenyltransferase/phosphoserine phosphatase